METPKMREITYDTQQIKAVLADMLNLNIRGYSFSYIPLLWLSVADISDDSYIRVNPAGFCEVFIQIKLPANINAQIALKIFRHPKNISDLFPLLGAYLIYKEMEIKEIEIEINKPTIEKQKHKLTMLVNRLPDDFDAYKIYNVIIATPKEERITIIQSSSGTVTSINNNGNIIYKKYLRIYFKAIKPDNELKKQELLRLLYMAMVNKYYNESSSKIKSLNIKEFYVNNKFSEERLLKEDYIREVVNNLKNMDYIDNSLYPLVDMEQIKKAIKDKRICIICGKKFIPKKITSNVCSNSCSKVKVRYKKSLERIIAEKLNKGDDEKLSYSDFSDVLSNEKLFDEVVDEFKGKIKPHHERLKERIKSSKHPIRIKNWSFLVRVLLYELQNKAAKIEKQ